MPAYRPKPNLWWCAFGFITTAVGVIFGILAVLRYFDTILNQHLSGPLALISPVYDALLQSIAKEVQPRIEALLGFINEWWSWRLELPPGWAYIFVPPWLYFTKVSSVNFSMPQRGRHVLGVSIFVVGGIVSLAICVAAGTTSPGTIWRLVYPIGCFTVFELALTFLVVVVDNGFAWQSKIRWQFWTHVPTTLAVGVLALLLYHVWSKWGVERLDVTLIMGFIALLGVRDLGVALYAALRRPRPDMTPWEHFTSQGSYKLGTIVLSIAIGSVIYALIFPASSI